MNTYFYERISTQEERELQSYQRQENALRQYAESNNLDFDSHTIYKDDQSGKNFTDRPEWNKLERVLRPNDTIVFKDICRFTRECKNGLAKYLELMNERKVNLVFLDNMTLSTDYIKSLSNVADESKDNILSLTMDYIVKLILTVELDRAEKEREITSQRIKDGIKASTKHSGRPKGKLDKLSENLRQDIIKYKSDRTIKQVDLMKKYKISRNTLKKYIQIVD